MTRSSRLARNRVSLLPYIQENIHGLNPYIDQIVGWEINKLNVRDYWKYGKGENIRVAVIDTGCDLDHPDLKDNLLDCGYNFVSDNDDPSDDNGHGSHVAGTIAASDNGLGMVGVAPKAKIIPIKALGADGSGGLKPIVNGILWACEQRADIITMSLGTPYHSQLLHEAIKFAHSKGILLFCAAGNSGYRTDIMYPARYPDTISIAAIDANFNRTSFSCSGNSLDFLAPGHDILSCVPDNSYAKMSGTSMSNPFAAGCAALALSSYGKMSKRKFLEIFSRYAIGLKNPNHSGNKRYEGNGIIIPINPSLLHN